MKKRNNRCGWNITIAANPTCIDRQQNCSSFSKSAEVIDVWSFDNLFDLSFEARSPFFFHIPIPMSTQSHLTNANLHAGLFNSLRSDRSTIFIYFIWLFVAMPLLLFSLCECTRFSNYMLIHSDAALHGCTSEDWLDGAFILFFRLCVRVNKYFPIRAVYRKHFFSFIDIRFFFFCAANVYVVAASFRCYRYSSHKSLFDWNIQNTKHNHLTFSIVKCVFCFFSVYLRVLSACTKRRDRLRSAVDRITISSPSYIECEKNNNNKTRTFIVPIKDKHLRMQLEDLTKKPGTKRQKTVVEKSHRHSLHPRICKWTADKVNSHTSVRWNLLKSVVISSIRSLARPSLIVIHNFFWIASSLVNSTL